MTTIQVRQYNQPKKVTDYYEYTLQAKQTYFYDVAPSLIITDNTEMHGITNGEISCTDYVHSPYVTSHESIVYRVLHSGQINKVYKNNNTTQDWFCTDLVQKLQFILPQGLGEFAPYSKYTWRKALLLEGHRFMCYLTIKQDSVSVVYIQDKKSPVNEDNKTYTAQVYKIVYHPTSKTIQHEFEDNTDVYVESVIPKWGSLERVNYIENNIVTQQQYVSFDKFRDEEEPQPIIFYSEADIEDMYLCTDFASYKAEEISDFTYRCIAPIKYNLYLHDGPKTSMKGDDEIK